MLQIRSEKIEPLKILGFVRLTMDCSIAVPDKTVHSCERLLEIWSIPRKAVRLSRPLNRLFISQLISWVPERGHRRTADEKDLQRSFSFSTVRTYFHQTAGW